MKLIQSLLLLLIIGFVNGCLYEIRSQEVGILYDPNDNTITSLNKKKRGYLALNQEVITYSTLWENKTEKIEVITQDDLHIDVVASIKVRPNEAEIVNFHKYIGRNYYANVVQNEFRSAVRNILSMYPMIQINKKNQEIEKEIEELIAARMKSKHIQIMDVNIDDLNLGQKILQQIEEKVTMQQEVETIKFKKKLAEEEDELAKKKAKTEAEASFIRAEKEDQISKMRAMRDAENEVIAAKARGEAQKLINQNLSANYLKLRAIESHYKAFDSPNSKLIFIPVGKDGFPTYVNINDRLFQEQNGTSHGGPTKIMKPEKKSGSETDNTEN
ncbi:MAG: SPFH domain-containing protein [Leptospiraceae bacterium]|nr:SPFH domain-containing protein [Leptospiraceae bacterium]